MGEGKGWGCKSLIHFCVKLLQSCPTLCDPIDCSPPSFFVLGILQARKLQWVAMPSSKGSSQPRDLPYPGIKPSSLMSLALAGRLHHWATREAQNSVLTHVLVGLPWWLSGKESACQYRRGGFYLWVGKILLEKEMATHCSFLAWRIPWTEEPSGLQSRGSQVGHDWATSLSRYFF